MQKVCLLLTKLAEITKDHFKGFLRDIFSFILDALKVNLYLFILISCRVILLCYVLYYVGS